MKYVAMSFDDGRADTYCNAYKIIKKYGLTATINVVTDFVTNPKAYSDFASGENMSMTGQQVAECQKNGIEIACHGATHRNTAEDILRNIGEFENMGVSTDGIGFASPHSYVTENSHSDIRALLDRKVISYIRTGIRLDQESFLYKVFTAIERITHSRYLFYALNKRCVVKDKKTGILNSVAVLKCTTVGQMTYFIKKMHDNEAVIFMFHSVADKSSLSYAADKWCWEIERFEKFCAYLKHADGVKAVTTKELLF